MWAWARNREFISILFSRVGRSCVCDGGGGNCLCRYAIPVDRIHCHIRTHYYLCKRLHTLGSGHTQFEYVYSFVLRIGCFVATVFDVEYLVFSLWPSIDTTTNSHVFFLFCCSLFFSFIRQFRLWRFSCRYTHSAAHTHTRPHSESLLLLFYPFWRAQRLWSLPCSYSHCCWCWLMHTKQNNIVHKFVPFMSR